MKRTLALIIAAVLCISAFSACGGTSDKGSSAAPSTPAASTPAAESSTPAPETTAEPSSEETETETPEEVSKLEEIALGSTISLPFVEITFESFDIQANAQKSIKQGNVTRTFGPEQESGYKFVILEGTIKNLDKKELPVYDFFQGEFSLDGYLFDCSANECYVYTEAGELKSGVEPLSSYRFMMYAKIPDSLASSKDNSFRFGFYDLFDNRELAMNRAFEKDPISLCPYQYGMKLAK